MSHLIKPVQLQVLSGEGSVEPAGVRRAKRVEPDGPAAGRIGQLGDQGFVEQEPVAELRVVAMGVEQCVGPMSPGQFGIGEDRKSVV